MVKATRAAALPSAGAGVPTKGITQDSFAGIGGSNPDKGGKLRTLKWKSCGNDYETSGPPRLCNDCLAVGKK